MSELNSKKTIEKWAELVNAGDVKGASLLFDESAVLLPTFSSQVLKDQSSIFDYFEMLGNREGAAVKITRFERISEFAGIYILTGIYSFFFKEDGVKTEYPARFTFVVKPDAEKPILHQHSSVLPKA